MSTMPAYFDTGFSVREPMWHGMGTVLDDYPVDWQDARSKADLLWEPRTVTPYRQHGICRDCGALLGSVHRAGCWQGLGNPVIAGECDDVQFVPADQSQLVIRDDTGGQLGHVGDGFTLVSHESMGEIVEAIIGQGAKFETAGSVKGGAQVWALAYLDEPFTLPGDDTEHLPFLALLNAHDGSGACKLVSTSVRVVCWNTYNAASMQGEKTGRQFVFRHTSKVMERIEDAKQALAGVRQEAEDWQKLAVDLLGIAADETALRHFVSEFLPMPEADVISDRVRENIESARRVFNHLYLDSPTVSDDHRGTALGLVHAATEYLDHVRGFRSRDTYLGRTLLRPEPLKAKATTIARRVCTR